MAPLLECRDVSIKGIRLRRNRKRFAAVSRVLASHDREEYWAVRNATFTLEAGQAVALVSKDPERTTVLCRALGGLVSPDEGSIARAARVVFLRSIPNKLVRGLSVEQAIWVIGGILGMSDAEMAQRVPAIVEQAGVEKLLGKTMEGQGRRLREQVGFAIALNCPADVIVLDRMTWVGLPSFRAACPDRLVAARAEGKALVLVTTRPSIVTEVATSALRLSGKRTQDIPLEEAAALLAAQKAAGRKRRRRRRGSPDDDDGATT